MCAICKTNDHAKVLYKSTLQGDDINPVIFSARRLPDRIHGTILRCTRCGLVYPDQLIDPETLKKLYHQSTYTYGREERHIQKTYARYLKKTQRLFTNNHPARSYLDIGCGNGFMLLAAKELGLEDVWGVEPSSHAIANADPSIRANIAEGMFPVQEWKGRIFDIISCFQTFDHVPDPRVFLNDVFTALTPGGRALFINHNIASLTARILGERCPMIDIEHTFLHTPHTMRTLFSDAGFTDIKTFSVRNDYPLRYWLHLLPLPAAFKRSLLSFVDFLHIGQSFIPFYPGNLGINAQKPPTP